MHSSDDTNLIPDKRPRWKKCPICWDSVYISETRPVRWFTGQEGERPQEGEDVVLRLIMRQPGSTLALPRDGAENLDKEEDIPWYFAAEVMDYARVMKGSESYMREQYDAEIEELQQQEKEDELIFGEETQWTNKAVSAILEAKERIKGIGSPPSAPQQPNERKPRRPPLEFLADVPEHYLLQHAVKSGQSSSSSTAAIRIHDSESSDHLTSSTSRSPSNVSTSHSSATTDATTSSHSSSQPIKLSNNRSAHSHAKLPHRYTDSPYYFYEALLHYYLSPLDIRILRAAFGDFASFPTTILPRVERVSTGHIVDDELRKRAKYLAHLPQGCEVGFLECDWTDIVTAEILEAFTPEIERRRKKNREKDVQEEKERVRAEKEEDDKRWAAARRRRPMPSEDVVSEADFEPLPPTSVADFTAASTSPPWSSSRMQGGFASLASPSTSPVAPKTVWGTRIAAPISPTMPAIPDEDAQPENDGWLQNWESDLLEEADLITQIEASTITSPSSSKQPSSTNVKKKKGKKITLMSTNVRRGA